MKYYYQREQRVIETEELVRKYGSYRPIPQLGIFELTLQPDYVPAGFNPVEDKFYPVEPYDSMREQCIVALMETGLSRSEAEAKLQ